MTTDEQEVASAIAPKFQIRKSADFKTFYVNWVQASFSPFDISLVIGEGFASDSPGTFEVEQRARVVLHPSEAMVIAEMLVQAVQNNEKQFGHVSGPRNFGVTAPEQEVTEETKKQ
jgi:hypothetical protein